MTKPVKRARAPKPAAPVKTAQKRRISIPGAGDGGIVPPPEHRFKPGNTAAVGHGRPAKLKDLQALIIDELGVDLKQVTTDSDEQSVKLTRARAMVRMGLNKGGAFAVALLEYAFGKVPQPTRELNEDEWREWCTQNGINPDELVAKVSAEMGSGWSGAGGGEAPPDAGGQPTANPLAVSRGESGNPESEGA